MTPRIINDEQDNAEITKLRIELANIKKQLKDCEGKLEKSKQLGLVDDLTGCFNQNYYNKWIKDNFDPKRGSNRLGLVFLDVNNLKKVNDKLGHEAGDEILIDLVKYLKSKLRKNDVILRIGGDEFIVICVTPKNNPENEAGLRARIGKIMSECPVSAAYGSAVFNSEMDNDSLENTKARADKQMYVHKKEIKTPFIFRKVGLAYRKVAGK